MDEIKSVNLADMRNAFAYRIGLLIVIINEIDNMLIIGYKQIYNTEKFASKNFIKKTTADRIKSVKQEVSDKDPNRQLLVKQLSEVEKLLPIRNTLAHGLISIGGDSPSHMTLISLNDGQNFSPESLINYINQASELSASISKTFAMISFYDMEKKRLSGCE